MKRSALHCGIIMAAALALAPAARAEGPCTADIAQLSRQLGMTNGLGAPVSEPAAGQSAGATTAQTRSGGAAAPAPSDRAQAGGASLAGGGSPGTVGGVAGPTAGTGQQNAIASGQIATSAEDVRRQSEGKPTQAQQAAQAAQGHKTDVDTASANRLSEAKMDLQRAVDLNAQGLSTCKSAIRDARTLAQQ